MKVVLFCGGLGMRLREYSDQIPKPMVPIGYRPIIWHLMKFYAHYGHKDFVLCLGHQADVIKKYFLQYDECLTNDFVLTNGGKSLDLRNQDIQDWRIAFVDTGAHTNIGGRLLAVKDLLRDEDLFLANYTDNLSDLDLDAMLQAFLQSGAVAGFVAVRPNHAFHMVTTDGGSMVASIQSVAGSDVLINGGFFIFRRHIFDYLHEGEELVEAPFRRLIRERKLYAHKYRGFWTCMDTFKEKQQLDDLYARGGPPWEVWRSK
jgi:glucose-1-phosphate cytidylyltransferase